MKVFSICGGHWSVLPETDCASINHRHVAFYPIKIENICVEIESYCRARLLSRQKG